MVMDGPADGRGDHNELLRGRPWGGIVMYQFHLISTRLVTSATTLWCECGLDDISQAGRVSDRRRMDSSAFFFVGEVQYVLAKKVHHLVLIFYFY